MSEISRRSVARGAAWAVPSLSVAAAAPSLAASPAAPTPALTIPMYANYSGASGTSQYSFRSVNPVGSTTTGPSFCVSNTTATDVISGAKVTVYLPASKALTFSTSTGGSNCWSALIYDASAGTKSYNGCTFYAYTTTYTCAITATPTSTCLPAFSFTTPATGPALCTPYWYKNASVSVNGTNLPAVSGPNQYI